MIIYFVGAGFEKTGVLSLGVLLKKSFEDEVVLVVLDSRLESKPYIYDVLVPIEDSHLPNVISRAVVRSRIKWPERVTILPNNTDCGYEVARLLSETFRSMRVVTSVVGIVHSNICTSIKLVAENIFLLDKVFAVSDAILMSTTAEIQASIPCRLLGYPSRTITKISRRPRTKRRHTELLKIIFVGRLVEDQKRFSRVLRLVEELRLANLPFILNVVGDGYMAAELAQVALAGSSVTPDVYPRGELTNEDVLQAMRESDVLVLTSEFEGSPFVVMEAMSAGAVPVVMDYGPEVRELITDGENGFVVGQGCVGGMLEVLKMLARDRECLSKLSYNALGRASKFMTVYAWRNEILEPPEKALMIDVSRGTSYAYIADKVKRGVKRLPKTGKFLIWGGGHIGRLIVDELVSNNYRIDGCVVIDRVLHRYLRTYRNVPYYSTENLPAKEFDMAIVASEYYVAEIEASLELYKRKYNPTLHITAVSDWR